VQRHGGLLVMPLGEQLPAALEPIPAHCSRNGVAKDCYAHGTASPCIYRRELGRRRGVGQAPALGHNEVLAVKDVVQHPTTQECGHS